MAKAQAKPTKKPKPKPGKKPMAQALAPPRLRAFLIGASPGQTIEHTRATLARLGADAARDLFIGVDGGTRIWQALGIKPHMAVGDWDSFVGADAREKLAQLHHLTLPVDKDRSDLFFAASVAHNAQATEVICLGVTGGRPDHHLAALMDLASLAAGELGMGLLQVTAYAPEGDYHFLSPLIPRWRESFPAPRTVSLFALGSLVRGLTLKGFKFPLKDSELRPSSQGLSNRSWSPTCEVSLKEGALVVIVPAEPAALKAGSRA
jgi:thiamine pyrophosphokinase